MAGPVLLANRVGFFGQIEGAAGGRVRQHLGRLFAERLQALDRLRWRGHGDVEIAQ